MRRGRGEEEEREEVDEEEEDKETKGEREKEESGGTTEDIGLISHTTYTVVDIYLVQQMYYLSWRYTRSSTFPHVL